MLIGKLGIPSDLVITKKEKTITPSRICEGVIVRLGLAASYSPRGSRPKYHQR